MIDTLPSLTQLLKQLQQVPFFASRHIYRIAHHFLEMEPEKLEQFCTTLKAAHGNLVKCAQCWAWKEKVNPCFFCDDSSRNKSVICVIETWYDLWALERIGSYQGLYHVLGGAVCPLEGIGPEDLTIEHFVTRVRQIVAHNAEHNVAQELEIILALNQTPEGEATAAYLARKCEGLPIKITCLSRGMPVGSALESLDRLTIHKALSERRPF